MNIKNQVERKIKSWVKRKKIGYSMALLIGFMISGNLSYGELVHFRTLNGEELSLSTDLPSYGVESFNFKNFEELNDKENKIKELVFYFNSGESLFQNISVKKDVSFNGLTAVGKNWNNFRSMEKGFQEARIGNDINFGALTTVDSMGYAFSGATVGNDVNFGALTTVDNMENSFSEATVGNDVNFGALTTVDNMENAFSGVTVGNDVNFGTLTTVDNMENAFGGDSIGGFIEKGVTIKNKLNLSKFVGTTTKDIIKIFKNAKIKEIDMSKAEFNNLENSMLAFDNLSSDKFNFGTITSEELYKDLERNNLGSVNNVKDFNFIYKNINGKSIIDLLQYDNKNYFVVDYNEKDNYKSNKNSNLINGKYAKLSPEFHRNAVLNSTYYKNKYKDENEKAKLQDNVRYFIVESPLYEDKKIITGEDLVKFAKLVGIDLNEEHTNFKAPEILVKNINKAIKKAELNSDKIDVIGDGITATVKREVITEDKQTREAGNKKDKEKTILYTVSAITNGEIKKGDKGAVDGDTVYNYVKNLKPTTSQTTVNLEEYYKKTEIDDKLAGLGDKEHTINITNNINIDNESIVESKLDKELQNKINNKADKKDLDNKLNKNDLHKIISDDLEVSNSGDLTKGNIKLSLRDNSIDKSKLTKDLVEEIESKGSVNLNGEITLKEERGVKGKVIAKHLKDNYISKQEIQPVVKRVVGNSQGIIQNRQAINELGGEVRATTAMAGALAALKPMQYDSLQKTQVMAGFGNYRDNQAIAVGMAHYFNDNFMVNAGITAGTGYKVHPIVNAGFTLKLGRDEDDRKDYPERYRKGLAEANYKMQLEIEELKREMKQLRK